MSPFVRARAEAIGLRSRLVKRCASNIPTSKELLSFVEHELELAIEKVPADYPALGGGGAVFYRAEDTIYVRDDVSEAEFAYLVGHELGHWILDPHTQQMTIAELRSLLAPGETQAVAKVEAYGARERQELQANVFARELLLPREVGANLWKLGDGAHNIAEKYVLPLELVRLQLLDGLLLPPAAIAPVPPLPAPSPSQKDAAEADERFVNVVAGPGTGKTTTLVHRVKYLIEQQGVDPSRILVLTFTNKAAFELVERLRHAGIQQAADIWAGTFHAFGLEFLRKFHQHFGLDANVLVADRLHQITQLVKHLHQADLKFFLRVEDPYEWLQPVLRCIQRLKEELVSPDEYRSRLAQLPTPEEELRCHREDIATLYELHERVLKDARMVDFVDLVAKPALKMRDARSLVAELTDRFEHVLVDEYQDVTAAMVMLVRQLALHAKSLWVVGDVRQAIHHWRGASVKSLLRFEQAFKSSEDASTAQKYTLAENRRSSSEILDLFSAAGRVHVLERHLPLDAMQAVKGNSHQIPELVSSASRADVARAVVDGVATLQRSGTEFRQQALLCRKSADVEFLAKHLRAAGVPTLFIGELAQRREVKLLLCLMQLLCEREPRSLVGLTDVPGLAIPLQAILAAIERSREDVAWQRGRWLRPGVANLPVGGETAWSRLCWLLAGFSRSTSPWFFVCDLLLERRFGLPSPEENSIDADTARMALWQFAYSVRNGDGDPRQATLARYLLRQQLRQRIGETYADRELPPEAAGMDAVRVMTVHGSKGLEFDAVHVAFIDAGSYGREEPIWNSSDSIIHLVPPDVLGSSDSEYKFEGAVERNNLFYVALSRARRSLRLYETIEFGEKTRAPQLRDLMPWYIRRMQSSSAAVDIESSAPGSPVTEAAAIGLEEFEAYVRCPLQYHYRYRLGLSREQDTDVSVRARWAALTTLEVYAREKTAPKDVFYAAWARLGLPSEQQDPHLFRDAKVACLRGLQLIKRIDGRFREGLSATIHELEVHLPWLVEVPQGLHLIRFPAGGASTVQNLMRPLLLSISGCRTRPMTLHALVPERHWEVQPSRAPEMTAAFKAAVHFSEGRVEAKPGRHCGRCAYLTMCPSRPAEI